jgi:hypothetical protein
MGTCGKFGNKINNLWALGENVKEPCEMHQEHQIPKKSHLPSPPHHLFPKWKKKNLRLFGCLPLSNLKGLIILIMLKFTIFRLG